MSQKKKTKPSTRTGTKGNATSSRTASAVEKAATTAKSIEDYKLWTKRFQFHPTRAQHRACVFLIRHGQQFLASFGYENAQSEARRLRRSR